MSSQFPVHGSSALSVVSSVQPVVEKLSPYVTLEWLFERQGFAVAVTDLSRQTTDIWFNAVCKIALAWPIERPLLGLYEFSYKYMTMSPYGRSRSEALRDLRPELDARTAVVLDNPLVAQIAQLFVLRQPRKTLQVRIFSRRASAVTWLQQQLPAASTPTVQQ